MRLLGILLVSMSLLIVGCNEPVEESVPTIVPSEPATSGTTLDEHGHDEGEHDAEPAAAAGTEPAEAAEAPAAAEEAAAPAAEAEPAVTETTEVAAEPAEGETP